MRSITSPAISKPRKATKIQSEKLQSWGIPVPETSDEAKKLIADYLLEEAKKEPVTPRQAAFIQDYGEVVPATKMEATELLDRLTAGPTPRQKAKLAYLGIDWPTTNEEASEALDEIQGDPYYRDELKEWDLVKYDLHPNLYDDDPRTYEQLEKSWELNRKREWNEKGFKQKSKEFMGGVFVLAGLLGIIFLLLKAVF
jgi:hypothetical protein